MSHATHTTRGSHDAAKRPQPVSSPQPGEPQRDRDAAGESQRGGLPAVAGSVDRTCARDWSTEPGSNGGGAEPALVAGWRAALARPGCSVGRAVSASVDRARHRRPVGPRRRLGGRSPSGSCTGPDVGWSLLGCLRRVGGCGRRRGLGLRLARGVWLGVRVGPGRILGGAARPCLVLRSVLAWVRVLARVQRPVRLPESCRTSCCRPSRGRTAGRRPRRAAEPRVALRGPRRLSASGRPGSPDDGGRLPDGPVEPPSSGGVRVRRGRVLGMPAGSRLPAPRPPATGRPRTGGTTSSWSACPPPTSCSYAAWISRKRASVRWPPESGWCCSRAGDTPA